MKVLHFLSDGRVGGPQVRIVRVHQAMNERIVCPVETIVASPSPQPANHFSRPGMRHVAIAWHKPRAEHPVLTGLAWLFAGLWKDVHACRRIILGCEGAIVHVNGAILLPAALAAWFERRPWVWHLNDTSVPRFLARIVRTLLVLGGGRAVAASQAVVAYYRLPECTLVVYPPVDVSRLGERPRQAAEGLRLGVLANLSPGKGVEHVIEAFAIAQVRHPGAILQIAGRVLENKRWYFESLQRRIAELGISDRVEFSGFVADPLEWMRGLDLFLFSSYAEAAPVAVIEALACGLPIVSGEIPPTREILGGCGVLTPLGDDEAMAGAICALLEDEGRRSELSRLAAERGRAVFSTEAIAQQYCRIYSELSKGKL